MMNSSLPNSFKVAVASFEFESNDFSPKVSGAREFPLFLETSNIIPGIADSPLALTGGIETLRASANVDLIPILATQGGSGGTVDSAFFEDVCSRIVAGLKAAGELHGVYLALHGAMTSPGVCDAEGELLSRIRRAIGPEPLIAVSLDLHANVTPRMVEHASILVGYENYPHDDAYTTGKRACRLLLRSLTGEIVPTMHMTRLKMLVPVVGGSTLVEGAPLNKIKKRAREFEAQGIPSVSYFTCQPWLDDDEASNVVVAIADNDAAQAKATAEQLALALWGLRDEFSAPLLPIKEAIASGLAAAVKPAILADTADCVGAGAPGDSAFVLDALIKEAGEAACALSLVDGEVARIAANAGVGAQISVQIGFTLDARCGDPVPLTATVVKLHAGDFVYAAGPYAGTKGHMGPSAVLRIRNIFVLVTTNGTYEYADEQFRAVDIDPAQMDIVVLKNGMNFRNLLQEGSSWFLVDSVGSSSSNLARLQWKNRHREFWPRDLDIVEPIAP